MNDPRIPGKALYTSLKGLPVYWIDRANIEARAWPGDVETLIIHDTAGEDSRGYLIKNVRGVSCHYLVGAYADTAGPRVYKYASESKHYTHTQGHGRLGGTRTGNINQTAISIELEYSSLNAPVIDVGATLAAEILEYWRGLGKHLIMLPHHIIDPEKSDPRIDWDLWCKLVYSRMTV